MTALLEGIDLTRVYRLPRTTLLGPRRTLTAVDRVSFGLAGGESLGLVGESGSGKTTLLRLMLGLERPTRGRVVYRGVSLRRDVQIVFQDPVGALDPRMTVAGIVLEPRQQRLHELLDAVGLPRTAAGRYPHEFSGGQRQRIAIARALAPRPRVLLADEPVSALDVSVRAQILNLLEDLRQAFELSLVLVSHDLSVVRHMCERVLVMHRGRIVEEGATRELFSNPRDPYTRRLLDSVPRLRWRPT
jgi:peptide/nickel transport system ATP-binding protein